MARSIAFAFVALLLKVSVEGACTRSCASQATLPNTVVTQSHRVQEVIAPQQQVIRSSPQVIQTSYPEVIAAPRPLPYHQETIISAPAQQVIQKSYPEVIASPCASRQYQETIISAPAHQVIQTSYPEVITSRAMPYQQETIISAPAQQVVQTSNSLPYRQETIISAPAPQVIQTSLPRQQEVIVSAPQVTRSYAPQIASAPSQIISAQNVLPAQNGLTYIDNTLSNSLAQTLEKMIVNNMFSYSPVGNYAPASAVVRSSASLNAPIYDTWAPALSETFVTNYAATRGPAQTVVSTPRYDSFEIIAEPLAPAVLDIPLTQTIIDVPYQTPCRGQEVITSNYGYTQSVY